MYNQAWAVLPRIVIMCIQLDVGTIAWNCYTVHIFRCGLYFPEIMLCLQSGVGCIAQNCYTVCNFVVGCTSQSCYSVHTFRCVLYCPGMLHCVYISLWAVLRHCVFNRVWALLPRTVALCIHLDVGCFTQNCYTACIS